MDAGPEAGQFLKRICGNYNYYSRWASGRAAASGRPVNDVQTDLDATLGFLRDCRSLDLATILLKAVHDALSKTNQSTPGFARQLNEFAARLADERGYRGFCRSLRIEWLLQIGDQSSEARALELLRDDFADALSAGVVPEVLSDVHTAFVRHFKTENGQPCDPWCDILMASASELIQKKQPIAAIELARRCIAVNEQDLVAKILDRVMKDQVAADPFELNLSVLKCAKEAGFWERAAAAVRQVLQHEQGKNIPRFWRDAAEISLHRQKFEDSVNELERASELEFASLPKSVNLQAFRQSYEELFTRFEERTEQLLQAGAAEKASFARQIQRAAGRWRSIDTNDTICCHRTAKMMTKLGLATAAWSYWTTPLANSPDQSAAWIDFAVAMNSEQRFNIADKAWSTAFQCESTNPDILLQHAQFLRSTNQTQRSREILTRITTSTWQPRFEGVKNQAQLILNGEAH